MLLCLSTVSQLVKGAERLKILTVGVNEFANSFVSVTNCAGVRDKEYFIGHRARVGIRNEISSLAAM